MKPNPIRPIAICLFRHGSRILVSDGMDPETGRAYCRPLGGAIEFGERAREAVVREIREELGVEIREVRLLGVLENLFTLDGQPGHEIVFVYDARFVNESLYACITLPFHEAGWASGDARWLDLTQERDRLVPEGLMPFLPTAPGCRPMAREDDEAVRAIATCPIVGGEMHVIETDRLTLEPLAAAHAEEMFAVLSDPAIYEFENQPPASVAALRERYRRWEARGSPDGREGWLNWAVRRRGAELIGYVQATVLPTGRAGIAYEFNSRYWRRGYGREATQAMLAELTSHYAVSEFTAVLKRANFRSLGLLICLGFVPAPVDLLAQSGIEADEVMMHRVAALLGNPS